MKFSEYLSNKNSHSYSMYHYVCIFFIVQLFLIVVILLVQHCKLKVVILTFDLTISFWVSVPVLSLSRYSILPSSSGMVLLLTSVSGMALSL